MQFQCVQFQADPYVFLKQITIFLIVTLLHF